ncbi:TonB-dependent receptor [Nitrobacter sp. Nb-311A]|uniref:TonB-dependent receptor plug domain-containing protein n=1 Tax=unclassified Nitrobacter TaxID=2620411 RepID=UPI000068740F|nr:MULTISPECIES: TonB-dependent receptor [unclassified Nitrobacter]EAQ35397.1 TonB-dependent receptor [Nitrobacter sp. Nb-311A]MCB1391894.1 TonB-dependent receptor [Nitrobacter sp.]MCV0385067.1 TonB-dependent receptor [Nitrobacter sp.]
MSAAFVSGAYRRSLLASAVLASLGSIGLNTPSSAQQSASPNLLPPIRIAPPPERTTAPMRRAASRSRRAARSAPRQAPAADTHAPGTPGSTVVSPTGVVTPAAQLASSITVITENDIQTQQHRSVPDILRTAPGLNVVQAGGPGAQTSIFMRGTNANHTKVILDGIDIGDPANSNGAFDYAHLLTADIQQMEILRGPQSGLYGSDAIGGVISIITKKGEGPPRVTGSLESGSFKTFNQTLGVSGAERNFNYAVNVAHLHAGDVPVTPPELLPPGRQAIGNNYDNMTYSTKLGVDLNENLTVNSVTRYTDATLLFTGDGGFPSTPNASQSTHSVQQLFNRQEAVWSLFDGRVQSYFGLNFTNSRAYDIGPGDPAGAITTGERLKFDWRTVAEITHDNHLIVGAEHQTDRMDTADFAARNGNKAGFVQLQSAFANRLFLVANVRQDSNDLFGGRMTYRIAPAVIVPVTETKLKASYGTGFKAPSLSQLFRDYPTFNFFANPNLKPEDSRGYDAGFEQPLFNHRVRFGSTYFHNDITNLIDYNATFTSLVNVNSATTEGTETFVSAQITERFGIRADYTFTRAVNAATGLQLLRRPKEKWSATATWLPLDELTLSATVLRVSNWLDVTRDGSASGIVAPGYTLVNLRGDYALNDQVKVFGRIDNLLDIRYQNPTGFLAPGLAVFGGIRVASYGVR